MLSIEEIATAQKKTIEILTKAGIHITPEEAERIEVSDFGLSELEKTGIQLLVYINTERVCAKEIVLFPGQTCPEHKHISVNGEAGKEETFRCREGLVYLYTEGPPTSNPHANPSRSELDCYTVWNETILRPGEQKTIFPDTRHWFQAGPEGAIVTEFSTRSTDEFDVFTDKEISRITVIAED